MARTNASPAKPPKSAPQAPTAALHLPRRARRQSGRRSGSANGGSLRMRLFTALKMAVFAPMPKASVRTISSENPGCFASERSARRRSFMGRNLLAPLRCSTGSRHLSWSTGAGASTSPKADRNLLQSSEVGLQRHLLWMPAGESNRRTRRAVGWWDDALGRGDERRATAHRRPPSGVSGPLSVATRFPDASS